jgi:hypothetical protein
MGILDAPCPLLPQPRPVFPQMGDQLGQQLVMLLALNGEGIVHVNGV